MPDHRPPATTEWQAADLRTNGDAVDLRSRILMALGGLRDDMPADDVAAVQRFASKLAAVSPSVEGE